MPAAKKCLECSSHKGIEDVKNFFRKHNTRVQQAAAAPSRTNDACESHSECVADGWVEQPIEQQTIAGVHQLIPPPASPAVWRSLKWPQFRLFAGLRASTKDRVVTNAFSIWRVVLQGSGSNLFLSLILTYIQPRLVSNLAATSQFWAGATNRAMIVSGVRKAPGLTVPTQSKEAHSRTATAVAKKKNKFKVRRKKKRRQQSEGNT